MSSCEYCGATLPPAKKTGRPRRFCSEAHRMAHRRAKRSAEAVQARHLAEFQDKIAGHSDHKSPDPVSGHRREFPDGIPISTCQGNDQYGNEFLSVEPYDHYQYGADVTSSEPSGNVFEKRMTSSITATGVHAVPLAEGANPISLGSLRDQARSWSQGQPLEGGGTQLFHQALEGRVGDRFLQAALELQRKLETDREHRQDLRALNDLQQGKSLFQLALEGRAHDDLVRAARELQRELVAAARELPNSPSI